VVKVVDVVEVEARAVAGAGAGAGKGREHVGGQGTAITDGLLWSERSPSFSRSPPVASQKCRPSRREVTVAPFFLRIAPTATAAAGVESSMAMASRR